MSFRFAPLRPWPALAVLLLAACGTTPPPDYKGKWKPVNHLAEVPVAIPLSSSYVFQASPVDGTLKAMLQRWSDDNGIKLDYRIGNDYTLYAAVSGIATGSLQDALAQLNSAYAGEGVSISLLDGRILVQPAAASTTN